MDIGQWFGVSGWLADLWSGGIALGDVDPNEAQVDKPKSMF